MYENDFREWIDHGKEVDEETFVDETTKTAFNSYILINKTMQYIVKALRVVKNYISEMEK